jgi:hypothetical protein
MRTPCREPDAQAGLTPFAVRLLGRIAIRNPHRRHPPGHHLVHDARGTVVVGLVNHRILTMENPVVGVRPLDANASLVAGDHASGAQNRLGLLRLFSEPRVGADEHVHQRALAHIKPERVVEQTAQPLVGKRLEGATTASRAHK